MRVFVAGAAGAIGRQLLPQLAAQGHQVTAATRSPAKAGLLHELGADPVVLDGLDAAAVGEAVARAEPEVVVHQMSSLAGGSSLRRFDRVFATTNRLRTEGTDHLLAAAAAAGARRFIAQSYTGRPNARSGGPVKDEEDPLDPSPRSTAVSLASTTSSTTSQLAWLNGCRSWPRPSARSRRCACRRGSAASQQARWACR